MGQELLRKTYRVRGCDFDKAGEAAAAIKQLLKELGLDAALIHRAVVVAFGAEMNVVMFATEGTVTLVLTDIDVQLQIADLGPGIEDVAMAMTEGYSTATSEMREMGFGFGMGLPNIKKNSDILNVESVVGSGTIVSAVIRLNDRA